MFIIAQLTRISLIGNFLEHFHDKYCSDFDFPATPESVFLLSEQCFLTMFDSCNQVFRVGVACSNQIVVTVQIFPAFDFLLSNRGNSIATMSER